jgi:hypothetical protein
MLTKIANGLSNLMPRVPKFFTYKQGVVSGLGVGVGGLGLMKPQSNPIDSPYDRRNTVKADLGPIADGHNQMVQFGPQVSIKGSGSGLTGQWALQQLADFQAGKQ